MIHCYKFFHQEHETKQSITTSVRLKSVDNEAGKNSKGEQISKKKDDVHEEKQPESEQPPVSLAEQSSPAERVECSEKPHESTIEDVPSDGASPSDNIHQGQECVPADPVPQQITRSRSVSVSSTGTYNVGSPKKSKSHSNSDTDAPKNIKSMKIKRVDSGGSSEGSSTGTYNVEDHKAAKVSGNSNSNTPSKTLKQKSLERADSKSSLSSRGSGRSSKGEVLSSSSHKKSTPSRTSSHSGKRVKSEVPEERPSTSLMGAVPKQPSSQTVSL